MTLPQAATLLESERALALAIARTGNDAGTAIWRDKAEAIRVVLAALPQAMRTAA